MEQKRVSFKVAKALKEAGYPQGITPYQYVTKDYGTFNKGDIIDAFYEGWADYNVIDNPFAMEVWLWLWREKKIFIELTKTTSIKKVSHFIPFADMGANSFFLDKEDNDIDPEEAIVTAIDYLVDKDLIK